MKAIIAVNNLGFIGLHNSLPWKSKEDLQHFQKLTKQSHLGNEIPILVAGMNTFKELPELKGRRVIMPLYPDELPNNPESRKDMATDLNIVDWCIGGRKTYERYVRYFTELHISHIDDNTIGDCRFPDLTYLNKDCKIFNYYFKTN